jgi:hypothetical protein
VTVLASVRGGLLEREFDLFSWRSALDGKEVIDKWIAEQPWSDGGRDLRHSYSAASPGCSRLDARAPEAVSASRLIGDVYRDITYPAA